MKTLVFFSSLVLFVACGSADKTPSREDSMAAAMKILEDAIDETIHVPLDTDSVKTSTPTPQPPKEVVVNEGIVYYTLPYCGGARPSEEIIAEKKKSRLLTNSTLKLKNKSGVEYLVTTNDKGIFRSGIPAGVYDVYLTKKTNKELYNVSPETCKDCLTKPMAYVEIRNGQQSSFVIHFACGPDDYKRP